MRPWHVYATFAVVFAATIVAAIFHVQPAKDGIPVLMAAFLGWLAPSPKELQ
jgi:hypothetical protein